MPTYEFRCPLGHEFERFYRSIGTAEAQTACPECGQMSERMMSAGAGLVFKGSGFYLTDYGKDAHRKKAPTDSKAEGKSAESGSSGGDGAASTSEKSGGDAARSDAKSSDAKSSDTKSSDTKKSDAKSAESKPAPKPSSGE
jgi:putative FmdB family regulatory protein